MVALIVFGFIFIGSMTFLVIRLSISCMFWVSKKPKDKQHVFKIYFPYYIISLFGICLTAILLLDLSLFAIYYFSTVFIAALLIWTRDIKQNLYTPTNKFAVEPNHPNLP